MASSPPYPPFLNRLRPVVYLSSNPLSLLGVVLTTLGGGLWLFFLPTLLRGYTRNPYLGILAFMILPGVFVLGLIAIPIGIALRRASLRRRGLPMTDFPPLTWANAELRRLLAFVAAATVANIIIAAQWGYSAVTYMDSDRFCGLACHRVMSPEYTGHMYATHSHVACADCHVGAGASGFVEAKVSGVRRVFALAASSYARPIPAPVENMRPARETCERCHWPQRFSGNRLSVRTSYASDEQNTASYTVLLLKVGGPGQRGGASIHGVHLDPKAKIVYTTADRRRQTIPQVTYTAPDGKVTVYRTKDAKAMPGEVTRVMDCLDCHNRPAHTFELPEQAVDRALRSGRISAGLPFIKKEAVEVLRREYANEETALREIGQTLDRFYQSRYRQVYDSRGPEVRQAVEAVEAIYSQNIFPEMKVGWGTYVNNIGHTDSPGCFRCHDGDHVSPDGRAIPNDCATCHDALAVEEKNPKILADLGYLTPK